MDRCGRRTKVLILRWTSGRIFYHGSSASWTDSDDEPLVILKCGRRWTYGRKSVRRGLGETELNTELKIISIGNGNGLELGPDGRRLSKMIAVFDVLSKL